MESSFEDDHDGFFTNENKTNDNNHDDIPWNSGKDPYYDSMLSIDDDIYCSFVESLDQACWQVGPLELWGFNRTMIENLSREEIIQKINHEKTRYILIIHDYNCTTWYLLYTAQYLEDP